MNIFFRIILISLTLTIVGCSFSNPAYIESDNYPKYFNYYITNNLCINSEKYNLLYYFNNNFSLTITKERIGIIKNKDLNKLDIYIIVMYSVEKTSNITLKNLFNSLDVLYKFLKDKKGYKNNIHIIGFPKNNIQLYNVLIYTKNHLKIRRNNEHHRPKTS